MSSKITDNRIVFSTNFIVSIVLILLGLCYFLLLDFDVKIFSYDEIFTQAMIKYSYLDIWKITATDVHPPLYYMMLKGFCFIFGSTPISYRLFSTLGTIAVLITGLLFVRKYFGERVSLFFILIVIILPVTQYIVTEVRMYSWAMFFVLATALSAYRIFVKNNKINYLCLLLFALCASYTHYFALLGVLIIFLILIFSLLYVKKGSKKILIIIGLFFLCYSFWLPELFAQMARISVQYWINKPGLKDLLVVVYYSFSPKEPSHPYIIFDIKTMSVALSLMLVFLFSIFVYILRLYRKYHFRTINIALVLLLTALFPLLISVCYSYLVKPILVPRYITCYLGAIVLAFAIFAKELYEFKIGKILILITFILCVILSSARFLSERIYNKTQYWEFCRLEEFLKKNITEKTTFIAPINSSIELSKIEYIYPNNLYLFYSAQRTHYTTKPFSYIEVNELPMDFDFFMVLGNNHYPIQIANSNQFVDKLKSDYIVTDSLIQDDKKIYVMKTVHRNREQLIEQ